MLRIISSTVAQRTPGNLSVPATDQQVLKPYTDMARFVGKTWQQRLEEKRRRNLMNVSRYEQTRSPENGVCENCGQYKGRDERGNRFCPSPQCSISRPRYR